MFELCIFRYEQILFYVPLKKRYFMYDIYVDDQHVWICRFSYKECGCVARHLRCCPTLSEVVIGRVRERLGHRFQKSRCRLLIRTWSTILSCLSVSSRSRRLTNHSSTSRSIDRSVPAGRLLRLEAHDIHDRSYVRVNGQPRLALAPYRSGDHSPAPDPVPATSPRAEQHHAMASGHRRPTSPAPPAARLHRRCGFRLFPHVSRAANQATTRT